MLTPEPKNSETLGSSLEERRGSVQLGNSVRCSDFILKTLIPRRFLKSENNDLILFDKDNSQR